MATDSLTPAAPTLRSPGFKFLLIVILTIAMAVPLFFIQLVLSDREQTASGARSTIATGWGGAQVVAGPILFVPYTTAGSPVRLTARSFAGEPQRRRAGRCRARARAASSPSRFIAPPSRCTRPSTRRRSRPSCRRTRPLLWDQASIGIRVSDSPWARRQRPCSRQTAARSRSGRAWIPAPTRSIPASRRRWR